MCFWVGIDTPQVRSNGEAIRISWVLFRNNKHCPIISRVRRREGSSIIRVSEEVVHHKTEAQPISGLPLKVVVNIIILLMLYNFRLGTVFERTKTPTRCS